MDDEAFREKMGEAIHTYLPNTPCDTFDNIRDFISHLHYISIETSVDSDYAKLKQKLSELDAESNTNGNVSVLPCYTAQHVRNNYSKPGSTRFKQK
jgi:glucose-6-phosphate 1-dehydrogenase